MTMEYNFVRLLAYWTIIFGYMFPDILIRLHIRLIFFLTESAPFPPPNPWYDIYDPESATVIIRSGPNPIKKYGIGYGNDKIRSDPIRLHT